MLLVALLLLPMMDIVATEHLHPANVWDSGDQLYTVQLQQISR